MEQTAERKLLYYDCFKKMPMHYNGAPIFHFLCKDVRTGEEVVLGSCFFCKELSELLGGHYYCEITDATYDFDILWKLSDEKISPVASAFEEVQSEYQRMLNDGVSIEKINSDMMLLFQNRNKTKHL